MSKLPRYRVADALASCKQSATATLGRAVRSKLLRRVSTNFFSRRTNIIFYHGVWPRTAPQLHRFEGLDLDTFDDDVRLLSDHFDFVSLEDLLQYNAAVDSRQRPLLTVCFDDGCDMLRSGAVEVLDSFRVPATVFVVTSCVGNRHLMWMHAFQAIAVTRGTDRLVREYNSLMEKTGAGPVIRSRDELTAAAWCWPMARKEEYVGALWQACAMPPVAEYLEEHQPYMSWDELRDWISRGHQVGLHTATHPFCDQLAAPDLEHEIVVPAAELRHELGVSTLTFAYPFGNRLPEARERQVSNEAQLSCMLGVGGLNQRGTDPCHLDRVPVEFGLDRWLFGKPVLEAVRSLARPGDRPTRNTPVVAYRAH